MHGRYWNTVADMDASDSRCRCIGKIIARDLRLVASRLYRTSVTRSGSCAAITLQTNNTWCLDTYNDGCVSRKEMEMNYMLSTLYSIPQYHIQPPPCYGWVSKVFLKTLPVSPPNPRQDFSQQWFHLIWVCNCISRVWVFPTQSALGFYQVTLDGVEVWRVEWPVIHLEVVFLNTMHNHSCFVYWSIILLEDVIL